MDGDIVGEMHLDVRKVNTVSQAPLQIYFDAETDNVSGYFFNFNDHKPTFKMDPKDQPRVSLTGGLLIGTYVMDQFHFHVYCTRAEAKENTLDGSQVPGEVIERGPWEQEWVGPEPPLDREIAPFLFTLTPTPTLLTKPWIGCGF